MEKPSVTFLVCGRFHYHKYLRYIFGEGVLRRFIYSYKLNFSFGVPADKLKNYPAKEYLMYLGLKVLRGRMFSRYLSFLHQVWQRQVLSENAEGNVLHFLVHGNCGKVVRKYKTRGIRIVGEVVNAHPLVQESLLEEEYSRHGLKYSSGEKDFKQKILGELEMCDYLLVPSAFLKTSLEQNGMAPEKIKVIPYGLDTHTARKRDIKRIEGKELNIIYVGQLTFRKGVIYLLKAAQLLEEKGYICRLTLVGTIDPLYFPVIERYLENRNVSHIAHVDNQEIYQLMLQQDLFIMPSIEDGFGVVVSEALSVRLPVIVTSNCGASEIVDNGVNGFVVAPFSEDAIADAAERAVGFDFTFPENIPSWKEYSAELAGFYAEILKN